jgi:hypothetical protein
MIEAIFRNVHATTQISIHAETLITKFLRVISLDKMSCGLVSKITSFFLHMMISSVGKPMKVNQDLILDEMLSMTNRSKVELFDARRYRVDLQSERIALIKEFVREGKVELTIHSPEISKAKLRECLLLYHAECIEILALCCYGPTNSISASRCMPVLPLEILLEVLSHRESYKCVAIAKSYGLFLRYVYLRSGWTKTFVSNEEMPTEILHYDPLWKVLSNFCGILGEELLRDKSYRLFIFEVAIPCLEIVLSAVSHDESDSNNLLSATSGGGLLDILILSTKRSLATLLNEKSLNSSEKNIVETAATSFGVSAYDFTAAPIQIIDVSPKEATLPDLTDEEGMELPVMTSPSSPTPSIEANLTKNLVHLQNLLQECPVIQQVVGDNLISSASLTLLDYPGKVL